MPRNIHTAPTGSMGQIVGVQQIVRVPQPAAGADWAFTFASGFYWRLVAGRALFTASAAVANRTVNFRLDDGANIFYQAAYNVNVTASLAQSISFAPTAPNVVPASSVFGGTINLPGAWLPPGYRLSTLTGAIDVADQWSAIVMFMECLDYGAYGVPEGVHPATRAEHELTSPYGA